MHSVLFKLGWFELHTYGLMLMLSFLSGIYFAIYRAKKRGINPDYVIDLSMVIIVSALVGARGLYVIFHFEEFSGNLFGIINPFQSDGSIGISGMTVLGGIILCILNCFIYLKYKKLPIMPIFNVVTPSIALGIALTRIGCFFHGCCFGLECENFLGIVFPASSPAGSIFTDLHIHPTQLYASVGGAAMFGLLLAFERREFFKDKIFFIFMILYGVVRFTVDIFRYYEDSMVILTIRNAEMSLNQGISILMVIFGLISIAFLSKKG